MDRVPKRLPCDAAKELVKGPMPTLLQGDCLEQLSHVADGSVDMVFADLPYGVTANKWDTCIPLAPLWDHLLRIGKPRCAYVFTATQPFATTLINSQPKLFRYDLVWSKPMATNFLNANFRPLRAHENVIVFSRATANPNSNTHMVYNPQMVAGKPYIIYRRGKNTANYNHTRGVPKDGTVNATGNRYPRSIVAFCGDSRVHPTQKPVALLEWLIRTYSNEGDTILDPVMGSGTTGVACRNTGRAFIGIEQDAAYYATACARIANEQPRAPKPLKKARRARPIRWQQMAMFA